MKSYTLGYILRNICLIHCRVNGLFTDPMPLYACAGGKLLCKSDVLAFWSDYLDTISVNGISFSAT